MKQKLLKHLDGPYYINICQYAPEYQPFYELKKRGWLWDILLGDSLIVWSSSLEDVEHHYAKMLENSKHYESI